MPDKKDTSARSPGTLQTTQVAALDPTKEASSSGGLAPWSEVIEKANEDHTTMPSDGEVAYAAMCSGVMLLGSSKIETFEALSEIFYRYSSLQLVSRSLCRAADADFLSLSATAFCGAVNTEGVSPSKCKALISAGESEAGQQVITPHFNPVRRHFQPELLVTQTHR
jgi:hypothetical protein